MNLKELSRKVAIYATKQGDQESHTARRLSTLIYMLIDEHRDAHADTVLVYTQKYINDNTKDKKQMSIELEKFIESL